MEAKDLPVGEHFMGASGVMVQKKDMTINQVAPLSLAQGYALAFRQSQVTLNTPTEMPEYMFGRPMRFRHPNEIEAAAVTFQEVSEMLSDDVQSSVVEFAWRRETLTEFFTNYTTSNLQSTLVKASYKTPDGDVDDIRFRLVMKPTKIDGSLEGHQLNVHITGGKSTTGVYQCSLHSIHPEFQFHVPVDDHRRPVVEPEVYFHRYHQLWQHLRDSAKDDVVWEPFVRVLVRLKPLRDGAEPMENMCGCC